MNLMADGNLLGAEKRFYQFSFTAHNHARKSFEPFVSGDFRLAVQPFNH